MSKTDRPVRADLRRTSERTITVSGSGSVAASPDVAEVRLGVRITRPTVREATASAAETMAAILDAVRAAGADSPDIRTTALSLEPHYEHDRTAGKPSLAGYQATNLVTLTVRDLEQLGPVVDGALGAGATSLDGLSLRIADPAPLEAAARQAAVADARARAEILAAAAGVSIAGVVSIVEGAGMTPPPIPRLARAMADVAPTPIEAGTTEVTVSVSVVYAIG
jgi:uncharacterized protein YggE